MDAIDDPISSAPKQVELSEAITFAAGNDIPTENVFETSAKTGVNVNELFNKVAAICLENDPTIKSKNGGKSATNDSIKIGEEHMSNGKKDQKCCQ